jgi:hypothetical protein
MIEVHLFELSSFFAPNTLNLSRSASVYLTTNIANSCGGKFGAPTIRTEPNLLKINAESARVPSPPPLFYSLRTW